MARPRKNEERILGPYKHGARWRLKRIYPLGGGGGGADPGAPAEEEYLYKDTEEDALALKRSLEKRLGPGIRSVGDAINAYCRYRSEKGDSQKSVNHHRYQLGCILPNTGAAVQELGKADVCQRLYDQFRRKPTKTGKPPAADTQLNCLSQAKSLGSYLARHKVIGKSGFENVEAMGARKKGKEQLTVDEAVRFVQTAGAAALTGDESAVVAIMTVAIGGRADELAKLQQRHVDYAGSREPQWLHLNSKTEAGNRKVKIPPPIRPFLHRLCQGKKGTDWLWSVKRNGSGWASGKIVAVVQNLQPISVEKIAEIGELELATVYTLCPRLVRQGVLVRRGRGVYGCVQGAAALGLGRTRTAAEKPVTRRWVLDAVQRFCERAGVPVVTAHGMRGLRATLATLDGLDRLLEEIAKDKGHASTEVTKAHYIKREALAEAEQDAVSRVLGLSGIETPPIDPSADPSSLGG